MIAKYKSFDACTNRLCKLINELVPENQDDFSVSCTTNKISIKNANSLEDKVKVAAFPGFIDREFPSLLARTSYDLLLFNCDSDFYAYKYLARHLKFDSTNAFCFGYSQLINAKSISIQDQVDIVFFEQLVAPESFYERCYLLKQLIRLSRSIPNKQILIKPRCKPGGRTIHKQIWHLERIKKILRLKFPDNLRFTYEPVEEILERTGLCITVSSTVAIEAMARGIPTAIISDFGVRKDIHTASFVGSGCLATFDQLSAGYVPEVNKEWFDQNVKIPDLEALKVKLNELLALKEKGLLPKRHIPEGAFSKVPDNTPLILKRMKKLIGDPIGFCSDSRYIALRTFAAVLDSKING